MGRNWGRLCARRNKDGCQGDGGIVKSVVAQRLGAGDLNGVTAEMVAASENQVRDCTLPLPGLLNLAVSLPPGKAAGARQQSSFSGNWLG